MPKLVLLDGHSLAYRAFYALPSDLATSQGQVTNAVYGFTSMLIKLLGDEHPDAVAVAWDLPGKTFRKEEYPEYKAQREAPPDIFASQLPLIERVATVMRLHQFAVPGFEADDVIATVAGQAEAAGWEVLVVTGDRDAFQLIGGSIKVVYTRRGISDTIVADEAYVTERYGITPTQYPQYAALRGDNSDNLPGVPGVGEKTAAKLINAYGSLDGVFEHLEEQTPKLRENLAASRDQVFLNHRLMQLVTDVDVDLDLGTLTAEEWDTGEVRKVFDELEFHSLWTRLMELEGGPAAEAGELLEVDLVTELDPGELAELAGPLTVEPVWDGPDLAGIMVVSGVTETVRFVPVEGLEHVRAVLEDPAIPKHLHDAKPAVHALLDHDVDLTGLAFDTALAAYVINPSQRDYNLPDLSGRVLNIEVEAGEEGEAAGAQATLDFAGGPDLEAAARRAVAVA